MDEILKFFGTALGQILIGCGAISVAAIKHIRSKNNLSNMVNRRTFASKAKNEVEDIIKEMRIQTRCNRVNLWQYSNGDKDFSGICFERVTCTAESVDKNTKSIKDDFNMVFLDRDMRSIINNIAESKGAYLKVDQNSDSAEDRLSMEINGLGTCYHFKIFKNNVWGGVVSFSFVRPTTLTAQEEHDMQVGMSKINALHTKMIKK